MKSCLNIISAFGVVDSYGEEPLDEVEKARSGRLSYAQVESE